MPLWIEKSPITLVGMITPYLIYNIMAHRVVDDGTSRIMKVSAIGAELNTLQHFGHNSRIITIRGRVNTVIGDSISDAFNPYSLTTGLNSETIITGLNYLREKRSAVLLIMNHSICYGVIEKVVIIDDREYPTAFDYEFMVIEKDIYGLKISALGQRILAGIIAQIQTSSHRANFVNNDTVVPSFTETQ